MNRDPLDQLTRSHRRLDEVLDALQASGGDPAVVRDAVAFFTRNVRRHEEDEEASLFPRLRAHAALAPILDRLAAQHREHEALVRELDADPSEVRIDALVRAYRDHIDLEDRDLLPAARAALSDTDLAEMAREMDERRGHR